MSTITEARQKLSPSEMTITCGKCGTTTDALAWTERPIAGRLPDHHFQCPTCGYAFRRQGAGELKTFKDARGRVVYATRERVELKTFKDARGRVVYATRERVELKLIQGVM